MKNHEHVRKKIKMDNECLENLLVPMEIQQQLKHLAEDAFIPELRKYLAQTHPEIYGNSVHHVCFYDITCYGLPMKDAFTKKQQYDLYLLSPFESLPYRMFSIIQGKEVVGAAIRICKVIGKEEFIAKFKKIVDGCFIPDEESDLMNPNSSRNQFLPNSFDYYREADD